MYLLQIQSKGSFVRGGPTLTAFLFVCFFNFFFSLMRGRRIQIPVLVGHYWPASKMAFLWHDDVGPTLNADLVALRILRISGDSDQYC